MKATCSDCKKYQSVWTHYNREKQEARSLCDKCHIKIHPKAFEKMDYHTWKTKSKKI